MRNTRTSRMSSLKERFTHHEDSMWEQLSDEIGGEFLDREGWRCDKIVAREGQWTITIDLHSHPGYRSEAIYTRIRGPYVNREKFRFKIFRQGVIEGITRLLGMQDVEVGDGEFDDAFILQATDEGKLKRVLADESLRRRMVEDQMIQIELRGCEDDWFKDDFPEGCDELILEVPGEVGTIDRLERLYRIFTGILHGLVQLGSAYARTADEDGDSEMSD